MNWPEPGVSFLDPNERPANDDEACRNVRVGAHAMNAGSRSTMWKRLCQQRGQPPGMGNHRGSVFRRHVGWALLARDGLTCPTWGVRPSAGRHLVESEPELEERVSAYLARLLVTHVPVLDEPGPESMGGYVERNAIALLSTWVAGETHQGGSGPAVGLWNVRYVGERAAEGFLGRLRELVPGRIGSRPT